MDEFSYANQLKNGLRINQVQRELQHLTISTGIKRGSCKQAAVAEHDQQPSPRAFNELGETKRAKIIAKGVPTILSSATALFALG